MNKNGYSKLDVKTRQGKLFEFNDSIEPSIVSTSVTSLANYYRNNLTLEIVDVVVFEGTLKRGLIRTVSTGRTNHGGGIRHEQRHRSPSMTDSNQLVLRNFRVTPPSMIVIFPRRSFQ